MPKHHPVQTDRAPSAIGPYSQAVVHGGLVYCSGQVALDPASGALVGSDAASQTEQVMKNLSAVLEAAGTSLRSALKVTIYLADMGDFQTVNEAYARHLKDHRPARATVAVRSLPKQALVEIDCVAAIDS
jgi:2-iminobutanoate/2-iminopropanoate deaminase